MNQLELFADDDCPATEEELEIFFREMQEILTGEDDAA